MALSILYLHIAAPRAGTPRAWPFPRHFLIRVDIDGARHVVDPFHDGAVRDAAELRDLLQRSAGTGRRADARAFRCRCPTATCCCGSRTTSACRLARREDWPASARSLERMLAIAPDRPELLFEMGQLNAPTRQAPRRDRRLRALSRTSTADRATRACASAPRPCCRNCGAGLTDAAHVVPERSWRMSQWTTMRASISTGTRVRRLA